MKKEIREGNLVILDSMVISLTADKIQTPGLKPLPTLEPILEALGFNVRLINGIIRWYSVPLTKRGSPLLVLEFGKWIPNPNRLDGAAISPEGSGTMYEIKRERVWNVHLLQNFYFFYTGKELKYNLQNINEVYSRNKKMEAEMRDPGPEFPILQI